MLIADHPAWPRTPTGAVRKAIAGPGALLAILMSLPGATAWGQSIQSITFANDIVRPGVSVNATVALQQAASSNTPVEFTTRPESAQHTVVSVPLNQIVTAGSTSKSFQISVPNNSPGGCVKIAGTLPTHPQAPKVSHQDIMVDPAPASNLVRFGALRAGNGTVIPAAGLGHSDSDRNARRFTGILWVEIQGTVQLSQSYPQPVEITFSSAPARNWVSASPVVVAAGRTGARFTIRSEFQRGDEWNQWPGVCTTLQANASVVSKDGRPQPLPPAQATIAISWHHPGG